MPEHYRIRYAHAGDEVPSVLITILDAPLPVAALVAIFRRQVLERAVA